MNSTTKRKLICLITVMLCASMLLGALSACVQEGAETGTGTGTTSPGASDVITGGGDEEPRESDTDPHAGSDGGSQTPAEPVTSDRSDRPSDTSAEPVTDTARPVSSGSDPVTSEPGTSESVKPVTTTPKPSVTTTPKPSVTTTPKQTVTTTPKLTTTTTAKPVTTTTAPVITVPDTGDAEPMVKTPVRDSGAGAFDGGYSIAKIDSGSIATQNFNAWNDGPKEYLFDYSDGFFSLFSSKTGGQVTGGKLTVTFKTEKTVKVLAYALISGRDSADWKGRTPTAWTLSGSTDGKNYVIIDNVSSGGTSDVNSGYFGYTVSKPGEYLYYKLEITNTTGKNGNTFDFQLDEFYLYVEKNGDKDPRESSAGDAPTDEEWVSALFGGGPFVNGGDTVRNAVKASGFNTMIIWSVHVHSNGDLYINDILACKDGAFAMNVRDRNVLTWNNIKGEGSSITRVELSVGAYGCADFEGIRDLINRDGTGSDTILYRNFKALIDEVGADAIDFDDESCYDSATMIKFGKMCEAMGCKVTLCPYTNMSFWRTVRNGLGANCDRIYLQCYDGGAGNNVNTWANYFSTKIVPGYWCIHGGSGDSPSSVNAKLNNVKSNIEGGFIWYYDDLKNLSGTNGINYYAQAINKLYGG